MDEVSFILLLLLATIMALFIKFLYQLYKDRGQLSVMVSAVQCSAVQCSGGKRQNVTSCHQVSDPAEDWQPGEFELPEYLHHSINDSQVTEDRAIEI